jgi:hypothetical protein
MAKLLYNNCIYYVVVEIVQNFVVSRNEASIDYYLDCITILFSLEGDTCDVCKVDSIDWVINMR